MFAVLSEELLSDTVSLIYLYAAKTLVWTFIFLPLDYCTPFIGIGQNKSISLLFRILLQTALLDHALSQAYLLEFLTLSSTPCHQI